MQRCAEKLAGIDDRLMELEGRSYIPNIVGASLYQGTPPQTALIVVNTTGYHPSKLILLSN
jgi:hypothetical protein